MAKTRAAPAAEAPSPPQGFRDGDSFRYEGTLDSVPEWADKGWASYAAGPALSVPNGDPYGQPYTTSTARIGDYVFWNGMEGRDARYSVVAAQTIGEQPGGDQQPQKPAQETSATLEDLNRSGALPYEEMNEEAKSQMEARGTAPKGRK